MSHLYLIESDLKLGLSQGQLVVRKTSGEEVRRLPFGSVDSISVYGCAQLSTQLIRECIANDISVGYYTDEGHYFGRISSLGHVDPARQKRQVLLTDDKGFCLALSRRVVSAKIVNSLTLIKSMPQVYDFPESDLKQLTHSLDNVMGASSIDEVLGFEGNAAKNYFKCLPRLLMDDAFAFEGRSAHPPRDPFNSMISYGYSLLYRNILGAIERHGLHPYFGFMHKLRAGHAALASDLIEEYRAVIVDKTVVDLVNGGDIDPEGFYRSDVGAVFMTRGVMKRLTDGFAEAIARHRRYYAAFDDRRSYSFQSMLDKKIVMLIGAIDNCDPSLYKPFIWEPE